MAYPDDSARLSASKGQSVFLGALVAGVLSTSYLGFINLLCCLGVIIGALVAVWHYTNTYALTIAAGEGAGLGALAGALGAVISGVLTLALVPLGLDTNTILADFFVENFADQLDPEQLAELEEQLAAGTTPGSLLVGTLLGAGISAIFGAIGGAIGAALFKKGPRSAPGEAPRGL